MSNHILLKQALFSIENSVLREFGESMEKTEESISPEPEFGGHIVYSYGDDKKIKIEAEQKGVSFEILRKGSAGIVDEYYKTIAEGYYNFDFPIRMLKDQLLSALNHID